MKTPRRVHGEIVAHIELELGTNFRADQQAAVEIQFTHDETISGHERTDRRLEVDVHAADVWRVDLRQPLIRLRLHQHRPDDERRHSGHRLIFEYGLAQLAVLGHHAILREDLDVGVEIEQPLAEHEIEAAHDTHDDDQHRHTERHPDDRDQGDDGHKRPLGAQITQRQGEFKRQLHSERPGEYPKAKRRKRLNPCPAWPSAWPSARFRPASIF